MKELPLKEATEGNVEEGYKDRQKVLKTKGRRRVREGIGIGNMRSRSLESLLWKRIGSCRKTDYTMNEYWDGGCVSL